MWNIHPKSYAKLHTCCTGPLHFGMQAHIVSALTENMVVWPILAAIHPPLNLECTLQKSVQQTSYWYEVLLSAKVSQTSIKTC